MVYLKSHLFFLAKGKDKKSARGKSPGSRGHSSLDPPAAGGNPFIRPGTIKAWLAEQDRVKQEEEEKEREKEAKRKSAEKKKVKAGNILSFSFSFY